MREDALEWSLTKRDKTGKDLWIESFNKHNSDRDESIVPMKMNVFNSLVYNKRNYKREKKEDMVNFCVLDNNQNFLKSHQTYDIGNGEFGEINVFAHPYLVRLLQYSILFNIRK